MNLMIRVALWAVMSVFVFNGPVEAQQNLVVRPMRVEAEIPPNRTAQVMLTIRNINEARVEPLNLEVVDLTQSPDGTLRIVTDEMRAEMAPGALRASSRDWVSLPADRIEVAPGETAQVPVRLTPPPAARGAYVSAVRILTDEPETPEVEVDGPQAVFAIRFGFLIPLITDIAGRHVRQDIAISDVEMVYEDGLDGEGNQVNDPTTRAFMGILNDGQTYSSLRGNIVVERRSGANWRTVTRAQLSDRKILPGLTLRLPVDLDRRLPSGEYRLLGNLMVDGRRLPRFEKVIEFEGDPNMESVAFDTATTMEPPFLSIDGRAGATRTNTIEVGNPGEQPLTVSFEVSTPEGLRGVAMGELMGEDISAADWTQIMPAELTLRPGQARNVRVLIRMPREGMDHANYYADIVLSGRYPDGQSAGETRSSLHIRQQEIDLAPGGTLDQLGIAIDEGRSAYIVQSRFVNTGNVDIVPELEAELITEGGDIARTWRLTGEPGRLLPLGVRDYAGSISLDKLEPGSYVLRMRGTDESGQALAQRQMSVRVEVKSEGDEEWRELVAIEE